jgi:LacI family transcriptional regulator
MVDVWRPAAVVLQASVYPSVRELRGPVVVSVNDDTGNRRGVASVCLDEEAIGALAVEHLLSKGLTQLTTFRFTDDRFAVARERAFKKAARARKARLVPGWWKDRAFPPRFHEDPPALTSWVRGLPRQTGVFACTDSWASIIAQYAEVAGVRVPEDLALVGVDNDTIECDLALPPLSSVAIPWRSVGEQAAALVEQALSGGKVTGERIIVPPADVVARRSTDVRAVQDEIVVRAISWIAENASRRLTLEAVARASGCSRQRLELRFRAAIGRTVMQEVRRTRLEMAKRLLATTRTTLAEVAERCGFADAASLSVAFRRETGISPGEYRRRLSGLDSNE